MREATGQSTLYLVQWHVTGATEGTEHSSRVRVIDGYTTVADIPRIIAVAQTGDARDAMLISVDTVTPIEEGN